MSLAKFEVRCYRFIRNIMPKLSEEMLRVKVFFFVFFCQLSTGTFGEEAINRHAHEHSDSHARPYKGLFTIKCVPC